MITRRDAAPPSLLLSLLAASATASAKPAPIVATATVTEDLAPATTSTRAQLTAQPPPYRPLNLYALLPRDALVAELERRHNASDDFPALLERVTRGLVAAPYLLSPLGEGEAPDPDPRLRLDAFDCTTFVETAIALARCDALPDVERELDLIRYRGDAPSFATRRHLMASDWVPGLIAAGFVEDITAEVGGARVEEIALVLDADRWRRRRIARSLVLPEEEVPRGTFRLPYLPIAAALERAPSFPPGTILSVVRRDVPYSPEVITHQGLILTRPGEVGRVVRHASPISKRVIDEPLEKMLARYQKPKGWPIVGVHLLRVVDPTPRRPIPVHNPRGSD